MSHTLDKTTDLSLNEKRALLNRLLRERASTSSPETPVHRLFEAQAAQTPRAIALGQDARRLTYQDLNERSNQVARHLRTLGVGPDVLVGVCLERAPEMLIGLLGVLKAGGAYVPLDPSYPQSRLALMLDDARVPVLLTEQELVDGLPPSLAKLVCIDSDRKEIDAHSTENLTGGASAAHLAYVIYTSGSTGKPKGVQIPHGALTNFLRSMRRILGMTRDDALLAVTTLSFDIAGLELFLPLIIGARVELVGRDVAIDGARLAAKLVETAATVLQATPATWRLLLDGGWSGDPNLTMICGGEALPRPLADRLLHKGKVLWNLYGPTETTIWSSAARVEAGSGSVSIGRPIDNTQMYVLDARLRPAPVGVTGELYIGGDGLARGYLGRPALTAERFVPDPFSKRPGDRLYRTGDLARWSPDGSLECLGRIDHQVKVRGFRIELGEIEAALVRHPGVAAAAVTTREDAAGEQALVGYVVTRPEIEAGPGELRRWLRESLPEHMVPAAFMTLDALPLTPNGKIDRRALPDPDEVQHGSGDQYVPPRGPVEEALVRIWVELLGRDRVGVLDDFFDLGGHSLFATQLLARVRDTFAVEPTLREFLDRATVAGLSRLIEQELTSGAGVQVPPIQPAPRDRPLSASFAQQRLWFLDQLEPGNATYNIPVAVRLTGVLDRTALERALNEVVRRHEVLRTSFGSIKGTPHQIVAPSVAIALPVEDLGSFPEADRETELQGRLDEEARRPFDLSKGPLLRATLIRLSEQEHVLSVTMHHIASDLWSIGILIREVAALYEAFRQGSPSPLPEPALQYADFAVWQRDWLQGDALQAQLDYWNDRLQGLRPLELPIDHPRPAIATQRGGERTVELPRELLNEIQALGRQEGATLFMSLLAAFQVLLHRYSGQNDIAVGTPIAGRTRSEVEDLIGFFVNTLVFRGNLSNDPSFRDLLRQGRQEALGAYAHQDLPFDQLVGVLQPERDPSRTPLFQVMFALQNAPLPALKSPELELTPMVPAHGTAKFELSLFIIESESGMQAILEYNADLFESATIDRMLAHFEVLLEGIVANPDQPVGSLPMLTEDERRRMLNQWNNNRADDGSSGLDDLFDEDLDSMLADLSSQEDTTDE